MKPNSKKLGFLKLLQKTTTVITASLGLLSNNSAQSFQQKTEGSRSNLNYESLKKSKSEIKTHFKT